MNHNDNRSFHRAILCTDGILLHSAFLRYTDISQNRSGYRNGKNIVFSVGGGNLEKNVSTNLVRALQLAQQIGAKILGVVGRDGGYTAQIADACVVVPTVSADTVTPHTESFQAVVWHLVVSHPRLKMNEMKWESMT